MALDGIITKSEISILQKDLVGAKVNKILQPSKTEIVFNLYNQKNFMLDICTHPDYYRICITEYSKPNPTNAFNFCMLLRKYLTNSKIKSIDSIDLDRIIYITFETNNELRDTLNYSLIIELMGRRSNIILVNDKNTIIDSLKHIVTSDREICPARIYELPLSSKRSFIDINFEDFCNLVLSSESNDLVNTLANSFTGFSYSFVENMLNELNIDSSSRDINDLNQIFTYIKNLLENIEKRQVFIKETEKDFVISLSDKDRNINEFLDTYYHNKEIEDIFTSAKSALSKVILSSLKKSSKKLDNINKKLKECNNMDIYKLYGELLTANLYKFHGNFAEPSVTVENYYNNALVSIPLDTSLSYSKNAEKFFKKYNKLKNTLNVVSVQKKETELELEYIESIISSLSNAHTLDDVKEIHNEFSENLQLKKYNYKSFQKVLSDKNFVSNLNKIVINGYDVYIGKNNKQNDYLSLHFANKSDIWFHAQGFHGAHVILKTNGKLPDEDTLFKCAQIAKQNCRASLERNVSVDYTYVKYLKKHPSGKVGMVSYTNFKTIIVP